MTIYRIVDSEGKALKFRGEQIASVESSRITTIRSVVWFELRAFTRDSDHWVLTISLRSAADAWDEVSEFYSTVRVAAAEDFLYDFDALRVLPKDLIVDDQREHQSLMSTVDHSYYAAVRQLLHQIKDYENSRRGQRQSSQL